MICSTMQIISTVHCIGAMVTGISASIPRYLHRSYYYFGRPDFYATYRGGHGWRKLWKQAITTDVLSGVTDMEWEIISIAEDIVVVTIMEDLVIAVDTAIGTSNPQ